MKRVSKARSAKTIKMRVSASASAKPKNNTNPNGMAITIPCKKMSKYEIMANALKIGDSFINAARGNAC